MSNKWPPLQHTYCNTIAGSSKNNSKNQIKKRKNLKILKTGKRKIEQIVFYNILLPSELFKVIFVDLFAKERKIGKFGFWEANLIFSKEINVRSPGGERAMVLL